MKIGRVEKVASGILQGYRNTSFGSYMWGNYKNQIIVVCNNKKQKLICVTDKKGWLKSKLINFISGIKRTNKRIDFK